MCRHNGRIWDRSYEGDINITDHSNLYISYAQESKEAILLIKYIRILILIFLDASVIDKAKKMAVSRK